MSSFGINTRAFFGKDRDANLFAFLQGRGIRKVLPVVDAAVVNAAAVTAILKGYAEQGYEVLPSQILSIKSEPTYRELDQTADRMRGTGADAILSIGGGTAIDLAKGVAVLLTNPGKGVEYRGMHKVKNPGVPVIAYPTTSGTGTEVTWTASFTDEEEGKKLGINGNHVAPLCGVLVPELVAGQPRAVALSSGLDTMVHAIEAVTARTATPITVSMGAQAFAMMYEALPRCLSHPDDMEAWETAQLSAYLAGIAMMNAGGGPASGISYPLGVYYHVPHGFAGGVFLPGVFDFNVAKGYQGYNVVYDMLADADRSLPPAEKARDFARKFRAFYEKVGGPKDLKAWNCTGEAAVKKLTDLTLAQRMENLNLNPVAFGGEDVIALLKPLCQQ